MKTVWKIAIVVILAAAVVATFAMRGAKRAEIAQATPPPAENAPAAPAPAAAQAAPAAQPPAPAAVTAPAKPAGAPTPRATAKLAKPRILELGSMRCQACLEMAKVLDALRASQGAKLQVDFIDVFEQPAAADQHGITLIPTQILYDAAGREIFRHTGFFSHDDVLAKFRELGVHL